MRLGCLILLTLASGMSTRGTEIDFSDLALASESFWNGSDYSGGFSTGGVFFNNDYIYYPEWEMESWTGWSYSNVTSTASGFSNQYSAITSGGIGGAGTNYAIAYVDSANGAYLNLAMHQAIAMNVTNTAYAYHAMKSGDQFATAFGPDDWFKLTIRGYEEENATGSETGSIEFLLANGTNIVDGWVSIDLTSISAHARSLGFELTSSDTGEYGMNTPAYFAMGSLTVAPEPGSIALAIVAGTALAILRRKKT